MTVVSYILSHMLINENNFIVSYFYQADKS